MVAMKTVVLGDPPPALASLIAERQRLGLDRHDEVWEGDYHLAPAPTWRHAHLGARLITLLMSRAVPLGLHATLEFNLGEPHDHRIPDLGVHRSPVAGAWVPTAAVVVELRSPHDETFEKFGFYFDRGVEEVLVADLSVDRATWFLRGEHGFVEAGASASLGVSTAEVHAALGWG